MTKAGKTNPARKPPVPSDDHAIVDDWLRRRVMPDLNPIATQLDKEIRDAIPGLQYAIKWGKVYYGLPDPGWIIELVAYDISVNIVFLGGADFDHPPPLGDRDRSRYVKLKTLEQAKAPQIHHWIEQAAKVEGWK